MIPLFEPGNQAARKGARDKASAWLQVRVAPHELVWWKTRALEAGYRSLGAWVRARLNKGDR